MTSLYMPVSFLAPSLIVMTLLKSSFSILIFDLTLVSIKEKIRIRIVLVMVVFCFIRYIHKYLVNVLCLNMTPTSQMSTFLSRCLLLKKKCLQFCLYVFSKKNFYTFVSVCLFLNYASIL